MISLGLKLTKTKRERGEINENTVHRKIRN
jgi:hypothetical protein